MIRLFVALEIPQEAKDKLFEIRRTVCDDELNFRWEKPEKLHLTLKFIGDVKEEILPAIRSELEYLTEYPQIEGMIENFGFFFRNGIANILWASLNLGSGIIEIIEMLENSFIKYGIQKEKRKFKPHLTLLRIKKDPGQDFINKFKEFNFEPIKFQSDKIILFKSELSKSGSKYFEIKTYHLN